MTDCEILIVGGGMAGASIGAEILRGGAVDGNVILIEAEAQPGYHATGRSVAFWEESYGGPAVQPLTTASGPLLENPDPIFSDRPLSSPRGALHIGRAESAETRDAFVAAFAASGVDLRSVPTDALAASVPGLRADWTIGLAEPSCADIDAGGLHQAYLRAFRRGGGEIRTDTRLLSAARDGGGWRVETSAGPLSCRTIVNAAGAWADVVAQACGVRPVGIAPLRRTVVQLRVDPAPPAAMPVVMDLEGGFYFKPEGAGRIWLSPHDEAPSDPCDAAPEELAVAEAIDRLQQAVDWRIEAVERRWAGLRSFAPDRLPIYGRDAHVPDFFWFAGQGGFGIQTAPAAALLGAALLTGQPLPDAVSAIDPAPYRAARFG